MGQVWNLPSRGRFQTCPTILSANSYLDELILQPFRPDSEGYLTVPDKPGLGVELNREALKRFGI